MYHYDIIYLVADTQQQLNKCGEVSKWSYRGGLENRLSERARGFESHPLRLKQNNMFCFFYCSAWFLGSKKVK